MGCSCLGGDCDRNGKFGFYLELLDPTVVAALQSFWPIYSNASVKKL